MEDLEASIESLLALDDHQHEYLEAALKLADWHLQNDRRDRARAHVKRALTLCLPSSAATVAGGHAPGLDSGVPVGHPNAHVVELPDPADRYAVADAALYLWKTEAHAPSTRDKVRVNLSVERHRLASTAARVLEHVIAELRPPVPIAVEPPVEPDKPPEVDWRTPMYAEPPPPKEEEPPPPSNPVLDRAKLRLATIREATGASRWTTPLLSHAPLSPQVLTHASPSLPPSPSCRQGGPRGCTRPSPSTPSSSSRSPVRWTCASPSSAPPCCSSTSAARPRPWSTWSTSQTSRRPTPTPTQTPQTARAAVPAGQKASGAAPPTATPSCICWRSWG